MPYEIETKDGIVIRGIPDDIKPDDPSIKQRVEAARNPKPINPVKIGKDGFADSLRDVLSEANWADRNIAGAGTALSNAWEGAKQLVGRGDREQIKANKIISDAAPVGSFAGNVALASLPFGAAGTGVKGAAVAGGAYGALQPVDSEKTSDIVKGKALSAGVGAAAGAGSQYLANKLTGSVANKISAIEQKVQDKAAQVAASETASARSAAGNAAQNAYKQLEHLRTLGANRALTAEEQVTVQSLERELAEKALDKLMPAAALKQETSKAYSEAMQTEAQRATQYAADKLSREEIMSQIMARIKRYGPMALGGALMGSVGGVPGAITGGAVGLYLRPALRSVINLSQNPAVQHGILSGLQGPLGAAGAAAPTLSAAAAQGILNQMQ